MKREFPRENNKYIQTRQPLQSYLVQESTIYNDWQKNPRYVQLAYILAVVISDDSETMQSFRKKLRQKFMTAFGDDGQNAVAIMMGASGR
jgi:hypothetical protein